MKKFFLSIAFILAVLPISAQKIPSSLDNPASADLAYRYSKAYKSYKASYYEFGAGLGVAALGYGLIKRTEHQIDLNPDPSGLNEGAGMIIVFEGMLTATGLLLSTGAVGQNLLTRSQMRRQNEKNEFLNTPGEDLSSWKRYRSSCIYDSSRKWMKASGIATCCLAGYTLAGVIGCRYCDNDFLYYSTETAMWFGFASGAAYLISWAVNGTAEYNLNVKPLLTYIPSSNSPCAGLCFTARF